MNQVTLMWALFVAGLAALGAAFVLEARELALLAYGLASASLGVAGSIAVDPDERIKPWRRWLY